MLHSLVLNKINSRLVFAKYCDIIFTCEQPVFIPVWNEYELSIGDRDLCVTGDTVLIAQLMALINIHISHVGNMVNSQDKNCLMAQG